MRFADLNAIVDLAEYTDAAGLSDFFKLALSSRHLNDTHPRCRFGPGCNRSYVGGDSVDTEAVGLLKTSTSLFPSVVSQ